MNITRKRPLLWLVALLTALGLLGGAWLGSTASAGECCITGGQWPPTIPPQPVDDQN